MASKRKRLSLQEKADIISKTKEYNGNKADFAKLIGVPYSTLQTILKQEDTVYKGLEKIGKLGKTRKTVKSSPYEKLENYLFQWFTEVRATNIPINGPVLKEKAVEIASKLGIQGFSASNGWIDRFKKRHNLSYKSVCGESAGVDSETVQEWMEKILPSLIQEYSSKDIFNADETGLFYNILPDKTFTVKGENCHGGKLSKMRLTVLLCSNSDGTEKLTPLVVGKSKKPRCFKTVKSFPTEYDSNKKSWMTRTIFEKFLRNLDRQMRLQKRKIILFLDQCTAHTQHLKFENVRVEFLPANCTSKIQPLDLGIIRSFKVNYRNQLVKKYLENVESGGRQKAINVLEALHLISAAWERVGLKCISSSFVKGGFSGIKDDEFERSEDININEIENFMHTSRIDFEDYVACDANIVTSETPTLSDLIDSDSDSCDEGDIEDEEECRIPSSTEAIQALKVLKTFLSNNEGQENNLQKLICVENAICDISDRKKKQTRITDFFI